MKHQLTMTSALVLALLLSACATDGGQTQAKTSPPGVQTEEHTAVNAQGDIAATMTISKVIATVEAIDMATRMVGLVRSDGKIFNLQAGEQVRNLGQVRVGDKVIVEYYEGLVAEIAPTGALTNEVTLTDVMARAKPGARPAGALGEAISATVVIEFVDSFRNVVHFKGPLGKTRIVKVMKPEFRAMLNKLKPGDQVTLSYFEALAVSVHPADN